MNEQHRSIILELEKGEEEVMFANRTALRLSATTIKWQMPGEYEMNVRE
jgi:predicted transcriptional regulator